MGVRLWLVGEVPPFVLVVDQALGLQNVLEQKPIRQLLVLDVRVGWQPIKNLELSLVGQNLLENHHPEFRPEILDVPSSEIERSVYAKVVWRF